ncbi:MAG: GNAT family N-acetyltransferase [Verrucomicrobia bacterium]|nr:GNAT family N-acetyltransferase [Verrucomicrobiota bacterium]
MLTARVCGGDLITRDVTTQAIHEILQAMKAHRPDIRALLLDHVPEGPRVEALQSCSTAKGVTCYALFRALPHYRLALPEQLEACLGLRSGKSLRRLESKGRALERALGGTLRLVEIKNEQQVAAYADRIQTLMGATWQARLLGHTLHVSDMVDAATRGILRSFMLMADETPIAFALCYQGCGTLMYEQPGFDPRYRKYSPGALLLYRMIEAVYRQDPPRYIDYGEGEARYKGEMANEIIHASAFIVHQGGLRERAVFLALALTRWLDRAVRAAVKATPLGRRWIQSLKH